MPELPQKEETKARDVRWGDLFLGRQLQLGD
jgi:hypothetical protein